MPNSIRHLGSHLHTKERTSSWLFHPVVLFTWILLCGFFSWGLWQSVAAMRQSLDRQAQAEAKLHEEEKRALDLIDKLNAADTQFAKEKIIRDELQMQRPGETVIQIPKDGQIP